MMLERLGSLVRPSSALGWIRLCVIALALGGCDGPPDHPNDGPPPSDACGPGQLTRADGTCQPAGLPPDMPCPPGELPLDGGACQKAGVAACGRGFESDGKDGCEPILPADACPAGQMPVLGDTVCHEMAPCGDGEYGLIPIEANTQFVNKSYAGTCMGVQGKEGCPWKTIQEGIAAATKGAIVAVAAGSYVEDVQMQGKPVRLWGRCPAMVEVEGTGVEYGTIQILGNSASGTEIRGVAVTGPGVGIVAWTPVAVLDQVWVHDAGGWGIDITDA